MCSALSEGWVPQGSFKKLREEVSHQQEFSSTTGIRPKWKNIIKHKCAVKEKNIVSHARMNNEILNCEWNLHIIYTCCDVVLSTFTLIPTNSPHKNQQQTKHGKSMVLSTRGLLWTLKNFYKEESAGHFRVSETDAGGHFSGSDVHAAGVTGWVMCVKRERDGGEGVCASGSCSALVLSTLHRCISLPLPMSLYRPVSTRVCACMHVCVSGAYLFGHSAGRHPITRTAQCWRNSRSAACSVSALR